MHDADILLRTFLLTGGDAALRDLIQVYAAPIVRQTLWLRLGFRVNLSGANPQNADAEDVYQEALIKLIHRLRNLQKNPDQNPIRDFSHYVRRIAMNACHDYLREKSPVRTRLKGQLRDVLHCEAGLKLWKDNHQKLLCGFSSWEQHQWILPAAEQVEAQLDAFNDSYRPDENIANVSLNDLLTNIFDHFGFPLELNDLVELVAKLLGSRDQPLDSIDDDKLNLSEYLTKKPEQNLVLESQERLTLLWQEVQQLPPHYRKVICLSFVGEEEENLLLALMATKLSSFPELASGLEISMEELTALRQQLPLDNETMAVRLHTTKAQINKWRHRALQRLKKRMVDGK